MIFVTIGTQEPFDRLIETMDRISLKLGIEVIAQVSSRSKLKVENMKTLDFIAPTDFDKLFNEAQLIVAHAGMGTIISALVNKKSLIVLAREKKLMEHRSDHQIATAKYLEELGYLNVARNIEELEIKILDFINNKQISNTPCIGNHASISLINSIRQDIGLPENKI
jgi:UDP-N-acetylglucosamine transferase subunit ALG13